MKNLSLLKAVKKSHNRDPVSCLEKLDNISIHQIIKKKILSYCHISDDIKYELNTSRLKKYVPNK